MEQPAAIIVDIDGTLISGGGKLSSENIQALDQCRRQDILVCAATARPRHLVFRPDEAPAEASILSKTGVFYSGAMAVDSPIGYQEAWTLSCDAVRALSGFIRNAGEPELQVVAQMTDGTHAFRLPVEDSALEGWGISAGEVIDYEAVEASKCLRITIFYVEPGRALTHLEEGIRQVVAPDARIRTSDSDVWLEVLTTEARKEVAMLDLLEQRSIPPENTLVFGNDRSDAGMFTVLGESVAMEDACQELKDRATWVAEFSGRDGVARILNQLNII